MKLTILASWFLVCGMALADSGVWKDPNGVEWTLSSTVRTTHSRAEYKCRTMGFRLPIASEFYEAVDFGMLNPEINLEFDGSNIDWAWLYHRPDGLSFRPAAWRYGETVRFPGNDRHWGLCARRGN